MSGRGYRSLTYTMLTVHPNYILMYCMAVLQPPCSYTAKHSNPLSGRECVFVHDHSFRECMICMPRCHGISAIKSSACPHPTVNWNPSSIVVCFPSYLKLFLHRPLPNYHYYKFLSLLRSTAHFMYLRLVHKSYCSNCDPMKTRYRM